MRVNYLKITWRNVRNNKFISFINVFGLAVGLTCCMLITLYLHREFNYDRYHTKGDRIHQLGTEFTGTVNWKSGATPAAMGPTLQKEFPEIEITSRLLNLFVDDKTLVQFTSPNGAVKSFYETKGFMADSTFFRIFDYQFKEGNALQSLMEPNSIVLCTEIAQKLFGKEPALNKVIHINSTTNGSLDYKVTGVFEPTTKPSHIDARFFLSLSSGSMGRFVREFANFASNNMFWTYLLLKPGVDPKALESKFPSFVEKYMRKDLSAAGFNKRQFLTALKDIHLDSGFDFNVTPNGNLTYLYILASIAVFILIIACINFMNLATARSAKRAAEVGVRKVLGAEKRSLIYQFLGESLIFAIVSFLLAIALTKLLLPVFSAVSAADLSFNLNEHYGLVLGFVALTLLTGLVAGSYPAFYLSAFKPISVLKGKFTNSLSAITFRKALVVFQFTISAALIIAAFAIGKQMHYMRSKDLGFTKDQQLVVPLRSTNAKNIYSGLKNDIKALPQISGVGGSLYYPGIFNPSDMNLYLPEKSVKESVNIRMNWVDNSFMQTLELKPVAGRFFSEKFVADTNYRMILNEAAVKKLGFKKPEDAIAKTIVFDWQDSSYRFEIIGVVRDFHFQSLREPIQPYAFQATNSDFNYLIVHMRSGDPRQVLQAVEASWKKFNPTEPFEYSFLDQDFDKNYKAESRLAALVRNFMIIAITICCLGLFGLATFSAEQRTKEIGIRKVLGSSVSGIVGLLSKDFVKLVLIGNLVAIPLSWYIMQQWLQEFAFRTPLNWWVFGAAVALSLAIALITVSYQAIKAALMNPVSALRSE
jgi:putative ABC transport system permease protein